VLIGFNILFPYSDKSFNELSNDYVTLYSYCTVCTGYGIVQSTNGSNGLNFALELEKCFNLIYVLPLSIRYLIQCQHHILLFYHPICKYQTQEYTNKVLQALRFIHLMLPMKLNQFYEINPL